MNERKRLMEEFHKACRGVMQARIFRPDHVLALFQAAAAGVLSDADFLIANSLGNWEEEMQRRRKADCFLCLSCDAGFYRHQKPEGFLIVTPFAATSHALVTGICRRCADRDDFALRTAPLKLLQTIYPDLNISGQPGRA